VVKKRFEVGLRIACLAWLGTLAHMMRTRRLHARLSERLGKVFGKTVVVPMKRAAAAANKKNREA
jgi:hypothetical protein